SVVGRLELVMSVLRSVVGMGGAARAPMPRRRAQVPEAAARRCRVGRSSRVESSGRRCRAGGDRRTCRRRPGGGVSLKAAGRELEAAGLELEAAGAGLGPQTVAGSRLPTPGPAAEATASAPGTGARQRSECRRSESLRSEASPESAERLPDGRHMNAYCSTKKMVVELSAKPSSACRGRFEREEILLGSRPASRPNWRSQRPLSGGSIGVIGRQSRASKRADSAQVCEFLYAIIMPSAEVMPCSVDAIHRSTKRYCSTIFSHKFRHSPSYSPPQVLCPLPRTGLPGRCR